MKNSIKHILNFAIYFIVLLYNKVQSFSFVYTIKTITHFIYITDKNKSYNFLRLYYITRV